MIPQVGVMMLLVTVSMFAMMAAPFAEEEERFAVDRGVTRWFVTSQDLGDHVRVTGPPGSVAHLMGASFPVPDQGFLVLPCVPGEPLTVTKDGFQVYQEQDLSCPATGSSGDTGDGNGERYASGEKVSGWCEDGLEAIGYQVHASWDENGVSACIAWDPGLHNEATEDHRS